MNTIKRNHILAIASGKGGVGKTWLSATLAHLFARAGKQTLLFDGDIGLANVDIQLGLTPKHDLSSVLSGRCTLKEAVSHYKDGGFDIIAGRSGSASLAALPIAKLETVTGELLALEKAYDITVLDLGAGIEQHVQYLTSIASRCLVVATDEPTSLTDAYALIKVALAGKRQEDIGIVINQAATQKEGEATYHTLSRACSNFLNLTPPLMGVIRRDNKVKESIRHQTSLLIRAPHSTAATDAAAISVKLMQLM